MVDRSRAGATWVTATGAFLLFASASVFVAVQWDHIPDAVKLAALGLLSGGCLLAGRALRRPLPATSRVLYHLGAFLIPVVSAALAVHADASWSTMLLVEGTVGGTAFWALDRLERSPVLEMAATASAVVGAVGLGACTGVAVPVILAALAVAAEVAGSPRRSIPWALTVGLGPVAAAAATAVGAGPGVLGGLGLVGTQPRLAAAVAGLAAAAVLGHQATRRHSPVLVVLAGTTALVGVADGWTSVVHGWSAQVTGAAALFVLVELATWAVAGDALWSKPARVTSAVAEGVAGYGAAVLALVGVARVLPSWTASTTPGAAAPTPAIWPAVALAGALALVGWLVADLRRRTADHTGLGIAVLVGSGWLPATLALATTAVATVAAATASAPLTGLAAVAVAGWAVLAGRPGGAGLAVCLTGPAALTCPSHPLWAAGLGLAGALILAAATAIRGPLVRQPVEAGPVWMLATSTVLPVAAASVAAVTQVGVLEVAVGAVLALWAVGLVLDNAEVHPQLVGLGLVPRGAALLTLVTLPMLHAGGIATLTGLLAGLAVVDSRGRGRGWMAMVSAALVPVTVAAAAFAGGATAGWTALIGVGLAVVGTAVDGLVDADVDRATRVLTATSALVAVFVAGPDRALLATLLIVLGALGVIWAVRLEQLDLGLVGGLFMTGGIWLHLVDHHVRASEAYLAPVAVVLLAAGWLARRRVDLSSWVAYGPAIALVGGSALVERIAGRGAGHALVAGAVGLAAVAIGGQRRLIAPLLIGTALLVALTVHESLAVTVGVPTWAWLALGGTTLVAIGIGLERAEATPLETGRRVVDVVAERFT